MQDTPNVTVWADGSGTWHAQVTEGGNAVGDSAAAMKTARAAIVQALAEREGPNFAPESVDVTLERRQSHDGSLESFYVEATPAPFPIDWNVWRDVWNSWLQEQLDSGTFTRSSYKFPPANFLADEVLGVWRVNGRTVELSEVTFPDLAGPRRPHGRARFVGITYGQASGNVSGGVVSTFRELERELGIGVDHE